MEWTFTIPKEELVQIEEWQAKQGKTSELNAIATLGGRWVYSFNPTSIGTGVRVKDLATGKEFSPEVNW